MHLVLTYGKYVATLVPQLYRVIVFWSNIQGVESMGHQVISTRFKSQQAETNFTCNAFVSTLYESNNP